MKLMPGKRQMAVYLFSGWISFEQFALVLAWTELYAMRMRERKRFLVRHAAISVVHNKIWNKQIARTRTGVRSMAAKPHWKRERLSNSGAAKWCAQCKDCHLHFNECKQMNSITSTHTLFFPSDANEQPKKIYSVCKRAVLRFVCFLINPSPLHVVRLS